MVSHERGVPRPPGPTIDDLLTRLEAEPDFRFRARRPDRLARGLSPRPSRPAARVRELVRAGRLQIGPWYVLADEQIPSGESLIRNLLLGARDAARLGGRMDVLYSPDAFGHPAIGPTLAAEFGIRWGVLWRGVGGEPGQERDLYRWRGPGGGEMLALSPAARRLRDRRGAPRRSRASARRLGSRPCGAGPARGDAACRGVRRRRPPRRASRRRRGSAGSSPSWRPPTSSASPVSTNSSEPSKPTRRALPALEGELRWSYRYTWTLQGVHATRAPLKRRHAECELWLADIAEPLAALATRHDGRDRRPLLDHAWRTLVRSQFHDSIGGCTSDAGRVARSSGGWTDAEALAREIARASLDALLGNDPDVAREHPDATRPTLALWNPVPRPRGGVVIADVTAFRRDILVGPPGGRTSRATAPASSASRCAAPRRRSRYSCSAAASAKSGSMPPRHYPDQDEVDVVRVAFAAPAIGGFGLATLGLESDASSAPHGRGLGARAPSRKRVGRSHRRADRSAATARPPHRSAILRARAGWRRAAMSATPTPTVRPTRDRARAESRGRSPSGSSPRDRSSRRWRRAGASRGWPCVSSSRSTRAAQPSGARSTSTTPATDFRLRLRVPTGLPGGHAVAGAQFGVGRPRRGRSGSGRFSAGDAGARPRRRTALWRGPKGTEGWRYSLPDFSSTNSTAEGDLAVTLLRSVGALSRGDLPTRPGHAGWPVPTPLAQCPGHDRLQLAFCTVTDAQVAQTANLSALWEDLFLPVRPVWLRQASPLNPAISGSRARGRWSSLFST